MKGHGQIYLLACGHLEAWFHKEESPCFETWDITKCMACHKMHTVVGSAERRLAEFWEASKEDLT